MVASIRPLPSETAVDGLASDGRAAARSKAPSEGPPARGQRAEKPSDSPSAPRSRVVRAAEKHLARDDLAGLLAHDLKTPLAAISMNLDFVLAELSVQHMPAGEAREGMVAALDDCRLANVRAVRIVSDMAEAVLLAAGERVASISEVDVASVVFDAVRRTTAEAAARAVHVLCATEPYQARVDPDLLGRALDRVLERALRHARADATIRVSLREDAVCVRVESTLPFGGELTTSTLATYFADMAMRAQGGRLRIERDGDGALLYSLVLPS